MNDAALSPEQIAARDYQNRNTRSSGHRVAGEQPQAAPAPATPPRDRAGIERSTTGGGVPSPTSRGTPGRDMARAGQSAQTNKAAALYRPMQQQQMSNQQYTPRTPPAEYTPRTPPAAGNGFVPYMVNGRQVGTMYAPNQQPYADNPWNNPQQQQQQSYQQLMAAYQRAMQGVS